MRIVHISDIHIRNIKYHSDYRNAFENLYRHLDDLKPNVIVNTGDTAHTKTQISPEFVEMCVEHIRETSNYAPYHIILGNHDLNLTNPHRQDAISPIIEGLNSADVFFYKKSGIYRVGRPGLNEFNFFVFSCADRGNYPKIGEYLRESFINIGLYHGSVRSAVTDNEWVMSDSDEDISLFDGLDFAMLGDIHRHQFLDPKRRIAYAGSLIQQNFGEDMEKGFLVWDIDSKSHHDVRFVELRGAKRFYTIRLNDDLTVPQTDVEEGSRLRLISPKPFTLVEQQRFEKEAKERFKPYDVISIGPKNIGRKVMSGKEREEIKIENLRDVEVQERLIRSFLEEKKLSGDVLDKIMELNARFQTIIEKDEDVTRDVTWSVERLAWSNLFGYGEENFIDFMKLRGIIGLFAPNSSGKSALIDVLLETLFDKTTKGMSKNIFLVNDNKNFASMVADVRIGGKLYMIDRKIEKIKYGQRSMDEAKEWGKTTLNFNRIDDDEVVSLNGTLRPETERSIRKLIGTYDDFVLTTLLAQGRDDDIVKCKETDRRKILSKFMDLDIFEQKARLARDDSKEHLKRLKDYEDGDLEMLYNMRVIEAGEIQKKIDGLVSDSKVVTSEMRETRDVITTLRTDIRPVSVNLDMEEIDARKGRAAKAWATLRADHTSSLARRQSMLEGLRELQGRMELYSPTVDSERLEELEGLREECEDVRDEFSMEQRVLDELKRSVALLDEVPCGDKFPTCKFLADAFEKKGRIEAQQERVDKLLIRVVSLNGKVNELERWEPWKRVAEFEEMERDESKIRSSMREIDLSIENTLLKMDAEWQRAMTARRDELHFWENAETLDHNASLELKIADLEYHLMALESKKSRITDDIVAATKELGSKESIIGALKSEIDAMNDERVLCDAYEHYIEAMGKHGISYKILVDVLPHINDEINKILSAVSDFTVNIEHDEEEQSIRLILQYGDYAGRPLELGGGAEKMLASIAIRVALLNITNLPKTDMFIIDEGFGSLDPINLDNINKMFDYLRSVFDRVLIVSHIDTMKDMVDDSIEISFDRERYSHVEVV